MCEDVTIVNIDFVTFHSELQRLTCDVCLQIDPALVDKLTTEKEQLLQQLDVERKHRQSLDLQVACDV